MPDPAASIDAGSTQDVPKEDRTWRGKFITLEGGEGTGKSTQAAILAQRLQSLGLPVLLTREPGGSPGAEIIRHVLLSGAAEPFGPGRRRCCSRRRAGTISAAPSSRRSRRAAGSFATASPIPRASTRASLGQVDQRFLKALERVSIGDLSPDLTLILDTPVKVGLERAAARRASAEPDRFESQDLKFHEKLREAFLDACVRGPGRCVIIRANAAKDDVAKRVWQAVDSRAQTCARTRGGHERGVVSPQPREIIETPHPRATAALFGHADAEQALLDAYRSGRIPHAFLIGGRKGIGKATLAYRMARFVLAHPDPAAAAVKAATSLAVDPQHPVARRIAAQAQGDLLVLERTFNDKGELRQQISVDDVRRTVSFFGSTAGEGGWRIAIVDAVDELNRRAPMRCSRCWRSRRSGSCCCSSAHSPAGCCRPSARAAASLRCGRSRRPTLLRRWRPRRGAPRPT